MRVQYEGCTNRWTFHPGALTKVCCELLAGPVSTADSMSSLAPGCNVR